MVPQTVHLSSYCKILAFHSVHYFCVLCFHFPIIVDHYKIWNGCVMHSVKENFHGWVVGEWLRYKCTLIGQISGHVESIPNAYQCQSIKNVLQFLSISAHDPILSNLSVVTISMGSIVYAIFRVHASVNTGVPRLNFPFYFVQIGSLQAEGWQTGKCSSR